VSVSVEGPPPVLSEDKGNLLAGPGRGVPAGRGMGMGAGAGEQSNLSGCWKILLIPSVRRTGNGSQTYGLCTTTTWIRSNATWNASHGYATWIRWWFPTWNATTCRVNYDSSVIELS
jgi:hypothetical protein